MAEESVAALVTRAIKIADNASEIQKLIAANQAGIIRQQQRSRKQLLGLAISVALDLALSVVFVFLAINAAHVSAQIHRSQLQACAIGNQFRAGQVALWDHVIAVSKPPPRETPAARDTRLDTLAAFRAYVAAQFKPVSCHKLYP